MCCYLRIHKVLASGSGFDIGFDSGSAPGSDSGSVFEVTLFDLPAPGSGSGSGFGFGSGFARRMMVVAVPRYHK